MTLANLNSLATASQRAVEERALALLKRPELERVRRMGMPHPVRCRRTQFDAKRRACIAQYLSSRLEKAFDHHEQSSGRDPRRGVIRDPPHDGHLRVPKMGRRR